MKLQHWVVLGVFCASISSFAADSKAASSTNWSLKMKDLGKTLAELLVDASQASRFASKQSAPRIEANAKKLTELTHEMKTPEGIDGDPSITLIGGMLKREAIRIQREYKRGNFEYARSLVQAIPSLCIGCHTRSKEASFLSDSIAKAGVQKLSLMQQSDIYAASRNFDQALKILEGLVSDPKFAREHSLEWERAVRNALAISVRVIQNPERAQSIVDQVVASPAAPMFLKTYAGTWKSSIEKWKEELPRKAVTEEGLLQEARRLLAEALSLQKYPRDRSAEIVYLRLSSTLHQLLRTAPQGSSVPEGLYLLGLSYDALRDLHLWSLHDLFFEACIRKSPKSEIAKSCYGKLEESVYSGYSGSGGTYVPEDVKSYLSELRSVAEGTQTEVKSNNQH